MKRSSAENFFDGMKKLADRWTNCIGKEDGYVEKL